MYSLFPETSPILTALSWALVHALWQGLLVYLLLRLVLWFIPSNYSSARYYTSVSALAVMISWFMITFAFQYNAASAVISQAGNGAIISAHLVKPVMLVATSYPRLSFIDSLLSWYNTHTALIAALYVSGIILLVLRLVINLVTIRGLRRRDTTQPAPLWTNMLNNCMETLQMNKTVHILLSARISVPMVMGTLKPLILIPAAIANQLTTKEAEAILLHELAHIRRNDYLVNIIQMFIETILFYNPFVWLVSSIIRKEREHCCDDMVVRNTTDRLPYAKALAALETHRLYPAQPALAATGSKNQLLNRIKRIMEMNNKNINYGQLIAVLLIVVFLLVSVTFIVPDIYAQSKKEQDKKKTPAKTTTTSTNISNKTNTDITTTTTGNSKTSPKTVTIASGTKDITEADMENATLAAADAALKAAAAVLGNMDVSAIVNNAMSAVDWGALAMSAGDSVENVDWDEVRRSVKEAMAESKTAMAEAKKEMALAAKDYKKEMANANKEIAQAQKEIAQAQKEVALAQKRLAEARKEQAYAGKNGSDEYAKAREQFEKALHDESDLYINQTKEKIAANERIQVTSSRDNLLEAMEKDGLIDRRNGFKIVKSGNELYIDGIKQSKEVLKKYDKMIDSDDLMIKGNYRSIHISTNN